MATAAEPRPPLGPRLGRLEALLTEDESDPARLAEGESDPAELGWLLCTALAVALRRGPQTRPDPARLIAAAQRCARVGGVPIATPRAMRATLDQLERALRDADAWAPEAPTWWAPLSAPDALETADEALRLPAPGELAAALNPDEEAAGWLSLPALIAPERVADIHHQLESAFQAGRLGLERAGVGLDGQLSKHRSDFVRYVTGLEPELLAAAPALAGLAQDCLGRLADHLAAALPALAIHPPQRAMLARYPAPSGGYSPHLDNPGGEHDNGRILTLVIYLNPESAVCAGGEIALWPPHHETVGPPVLVAPPRGGSAVLFHARSVPHQVRPLGDGAARWALTLWLNDAPQRPAALPPAPVPSLDEVLLPLAAPPLAAGVVLFHELDEPGAGRIRAQRVVQGVAPRTPRAGIVTTVYRGGELLDAFCRHHLELGFDHLALVFDHLEEPEERADAERLRARFGPERLSLLAGSAIAERWEALGASPELAELVRCARSGATNWAIASRQTLNASVVLEAARGTELGGAPLDWLLHLDADERFHLEGTGRGGGSLAEHFAAAENAGWVQLRYLNHELLHSADPRAPPRYKLNPRLAAVRLGPVGWARLVRHLAMAPTDPRPYFHGYSNGKSAVAVGAAARAAGVHGWRLRAPGAERLLAGPVVLHAHFASPAAFARKFLAVAGSEIPAGPRPFIPAPAEEAALALIAETRASGHDDAEIGHRLEALHKRLTRFSERDVELLETAGVLVEAPDRPGFRP